MLQHNRWAVAAYAGILIAIIAIVDWQVEFNATLAFLYIFPLVLLGTILNWWQLILVTVLCTFLSHQLDPFAMEDQMARDLLVFLTLSITGFLSLGVTKAYRAEMAGRARLEEEVLARRAARGPAGVPDRKQPAETRS